MKKSIFEQKITHKVLSFKLDESAKLIDLLLDDPDASENFKKQLKLKNVCAQLQEPLVNRLESTLSILSMSKREFLELAIIEALDKSDLIMKDCGIDDFLQQNTSAVGDIEEVSQ